MLLEYTTLDGEKHQVKASISYDHPACSYGQPVILVEGEPLDMPSWILLGYRVIRANREELKALRKIYTQIGYAFI